ncbi:hypothetical protein ACQZ6A_22285 [Agrobacterium vitis]
MRIPLGRDYDAILDVFCDPSYLIVKLQVFAGILKAVMVIVKLAKIARLSVLRSLIKVLAVGKNEWIDKAAWLRAPPFG